jgi:hypothetical protein
MTDYDVVDACIRPIGHLEVLSRLEVNKLLDTTQGGLYSLFRNCALAVLNSGSTLDDGKELLERYQSFDIRVVQQERGIKLELKGAPAHAFVGGKMIRGINEQLFAVLRDVIYVADEINTNSSFDLSTSDGITNAVFHILRNAGILQARSEPNMVVHQGGGLSDGAARYRYLHRMRPRCDEGADERGDHRPRQTAH